MLDNTHCGDLTQRKKRLAPLSFLFGLLLWTAPSLITAQVERAPAPGSSASDRESRKTRIFQQLMAEAEQALRQGRLTTPAHNNAYDKFNAAQMLQPGNPRVEEGLQAVVQSYIARIDNALAQGRLEAAETLLNRAKRVAPDNHQELAGLQQKLREAYALIPTSSEPDDDNRVWLSPTALGARGPSITNILHDLGRTVRETNSAVHIYARNDEEGRWIYSTLKDAVPGYRIRGDIRISSRPYIQLLEPLP